MMSAHDPMAPCSWLFLSSHYSMAPSSWVFMASPNWFSWAIMGTHEHPLALMVTNKHLRATMSVPDCQWALMSVHEHSWAWGHRAISTHGSSKAVMSMAPWGHGRSSALMSAHCAIAPYLWLLMSAHQCLWELMSSHDSSWVSSASLNKKQKYQILKWAPWSIFPISRSIFHWIIENWKFLKSTQNVLLKNVQDGISRHLGSREIKNLKVATILQDMLRESWVVLAVWIYCWLWAN